MRIQLESSVFRFLDLVDLNCVVICAGIDTLHAVIADFIGIEVALLAFAAIIADFIIIQHTALFHANPSPIADGNFIRNIISTVIIILFSTEKCNRKQT